MSVIAPCITVETPEEYKASVERLHPFASRVHIDVSDGEFSPAFLMADAQIWWPQEWTVDIHAMVARPNDYVDKFISMKPHLIIFHAETGIDLVPIFQKIQAAGIKAGVSLLRQTVPSTVTRFIQAVDHVMVFSGDLGHYGGKASLMQLEKVRLIKGISPNVEIGWDGGVNQENAYTLTQGGVDVLNVGGAIARAEDPSAMYATLVNEINKHGVL